MHRSAIMISAICQTMQKLRPAFLRQTCVVRGNKNIYNDLQRRPFHKLPAELYLPPSFLPAYTVRPCHRLIPGWRVVRIKMNTWINPNIF